MTDIRIEHDTLGAVEVPAGRLWGAQTQRSLQHFAISVETMPAELLRAIAEVKRAAAIVNRQLGLLEPDKADAIVAAADEVLSGAHEGEFPLSVWQTGSGTQTNMNLNEVLANRASELLGGERGEARLVHPNDDVNRGQSSNDVLPTAIHVAALVALSRRLRPDLDALRATLAAKARAFDDLVKIGRTHLQDATPLTLGQEMSGWLGQLDRAAAAIDQAAPALRRLAIGGTAVGTGLNTHPEFGENVCRVLAERTGIDFEPAPDRFAAQAGHEAVAALHGALRVLAIALTKIANDVRWLASGPRAGLAELRLPENEPGSSIMPGKVNPTQCEALVMACAQVMGNDVALGIGAAGGQFQLNTCQPLIAHNLLQSLRLLADAIASFDRHCARGIEADRARIAEFVERSLMLVTALAPHIGYDRAAEIAKRAHAEGSSLRDAALALGYVSAAEFDAWVRPERMLGR
jgi:fumarate hydratase class II